MTTESQRRDDVNFMKYLDPFLDSACEAPCARGLRSRAIPNLLVWVFSRFWFAAQAAVERDFPTIAGQSYQLRGGADCCLARSLPSIRTQQTDETGYCIWDR